jgi:hypothetical protein
LKFSVGRGQVWRHLKNCIKLRRIVDKAAFALREQKRAELSGDIEAAYQSALKRLELAEAKGDLPLILKAQAASSKLLRLRKERAPAIERVTARITTDKRRQAAGAITVQFPDECRNGLAAMMVEDVISNRQRLSSRNPEFSAEEVAREFPMPTDAEIRAHVLDQFPIPSEAELRNSDMRIIVRFIERRPRPVRSYTPHLEDLGSPTKEDVRLPDHPGYGVN